MKLAEFIIFFCIGWCMLLLQQECCHHNILDFQSLLAWERSVMERYYEIRVDFITSNNHVTF